MYQTFDEDVMDDLFYEAVEGPAATSFEDDFDTMLDFADYGDFDAALEEVVADALEAEDTDEFLGRLLGGLSTIVRQAAPAARQAAGAVGRAARAAAPRVAQAARAVHRAAQTAAPHVSRVARAVSQQATARAQQGPLSIGGMTLSPAQLQHIGQLSRLIGNLTGFEDFDALDEMLDYAELEDAVDDAAPAIAGLAIRTAMPAVSRLSPAARRQLVQNVSQATRTLAQQQGPQAARAIVPIVQSAQRAARRQQLPPRAVATAVRQRAAQAARSPQQVRRLVAQSGTTVPLMGGRQVSPSAVRPRGSVPRIAICPSCGVAHHSPLRRPIHPMIR
jgi:hypothetical protein